jgi:transcriptional regulator
MHGYAIATWLEARSNGTLGIDDSALYQALQRMEGRGWLAAEWGTSDNNRRARYYRLTAAGRQRLRTESDTWLRYTKSVTAILAVAQRGT